MNAQGLAEYADQVYKATAGLVKMVPEKKLNWRPAETNNWMTMGQLLDHLASATGRPMQGFITGQWPEMPGAEDGMLPPAEKWPSVWTVAEALRKLEADRRLTAQLLADLPDEDFRGRMVAAPWNPAPLPLCSQLLHMVEHQISHKTMLFAYLKLLGVEVTTGHLYGMA